MRAITVILLILCAAVNISAKPGINTQLSKGEIGMEFLGGYAIPMSASYVDTYENQDIYWNPNSGINLDFRLKYQISDYLSFVLPIDLVAGIYQYDTTDGRKVNTEANAGNNPDTVNTEWSFSPSIIPMLQMKTGLNPAAPYIGVGAGIGFLWSYESWSFTNNDGDNALLLIDKYYWPSPVFRGEIGWDIPYKSDFNLKIAGVFNMVNYAMNRVVLSHYFINSQDTINNFDVKDKIYSYAYNVPDENKGGDCLLAGFAYNNYPQQKICTNLTVKVGITLHL